MKELLIEQGGVNLLVNVTFKIDVLPSDARTLKRITVVLYSKKHF